MSLPIIENNAAQAQSAIPVVIVGGESEAPSEIESLLGAIDDAPATDPNSNATIIALLKGILKTQLLIEENTRNMNPDPGA